MAEETFKDRLVTERAELVVKIKALNKFLIGGNHSMIDPAQLALLRIQYSAMETYSRCLQERLLTL